MRALPDRIIASILFLRWQPIRLRRRRSAERITLAENEERIVDVRVTDPSRQVFRARSPISIRQSRADGSEWNQRSLVRDGDGGRADPR